MCSEVENEEDDLVQCARCENMEDPDHLIKASNGEKICDSCYEIDPVPTSEECDQCPAPATSNVCGTNLCDDCRANYHH